jgi:hypothetical protein
MLVAGLEEHFNQQESPTEHLGLLIQVMVVEVGLLLARQQEQLP